MACSSGHLFTGWVKEDKHVAEALWYLGYSQSFASRMWAGASRGVLRFSLNSHDEWPFTAMLSGTYLDCV